MSLRRLSPTANLLRTSRLFSLPPPLPRPTPEYSAAANFDSDTATTSYPTHAAIETTQTSLARGDWGLKRALPLKSTTKSSTPVIKIDNIDSIDFITDFGSAADHAITLRKWQELNMPIQMHEKRRTISDSRPQAKSVFDSQYDNTYVEKEKILSRPSKERWKYKGPWLAGKTDGEFSNYLEKKVKRRKLDFRQYLGNHVAQTKFAARRVEAVEKGEDLNGLSPAQITVTEKDVDEYVRHLRNNEWDLHNLVQEYLDLPRDESQSLGESSQYDENGPPTTHPSAGLSYLRTDSHIYNHPNFGPQEHKAPIEGRVIVPQKTGERSNPQALIGVAGFVGKDSRMTFWQEKTVEKKIAAVGQFDPDISGGGKLWVSPKRASVDSHGRVNLVLDRADKNALNVALGVHSDGPQPPSAALAAAHDREFPDVTQTTQKGTRPTSGYGIEKSTGPRSSARATPFLGPDDKAPDTATALHELLRTGSLGSRK